MKIKSLEFVCFLIVVGLSAVLFFAMKSKQPNVPTEAITTVAQTTTTQAVANSTNVAAVKDDKDSQWINDEINAIEPQAANLNKEVLKVSLIAYEHAEKRGITHSPLLTIVDYSKASSEKRIWVVDLEKKKVLFNTWVAHGKNSGNVTPTSFSNSPESLKSSIGVFVTGDVYEGKHGNSLHVHGLEAGVNDNAYSRSIVFHGASYVGADIAKSGRIGRSWGCWAVSEDIIPSLIKTIKDKVLVVAYYPDKKWLSHSTFLN